MSSSALPMIAGLGTRIRPLGARPGTPERRRAVGRAASFNSRVMDAPPALMATSKSITASHVILKVQGRPEVRVPLLDLSRVGAGGKPRRRANSLNASTASTTAALFASKAPLPPGWVGGGGGGGGGGEGGLGPTAGGEGVGEKKPPAAAAVLTPAAWGAGGGGLGRGKLRLPPITPAAPPGGPLSAKGAEGEADTPTTPDVSVGCWCWGRAKRRVLSAPRPISDDYESYDYE